MLKRILLGILLIVLIIAGVLWGKPVYTRVIKLVVPGPKLVMGTSKEFTVNLNDPGMRRYLRVRLTFEYLNKKALVQELGDRDPEIRDTIIRVLRSKTVEELANAASTDILRAELVEALNSVLKKGEIEDIYFIEFVIQ